MVLSDYPHIMADTTGSFAKFTLQQRFPKVICEVMDTANLDIEGKRMLLSLKDAFTYRIIRLPHPPQEEIEWMDFYRQFEGRILSDLPFFDAEVYFYRAILEGTRYFDNHNDPFLPTKQRELNRISFFASELLQRYFSGLYTVKNLLRLSTQGNSFDLSQLTTSTGNATKLIKDESDFLIECLSKGYELEFIADNAGIELFYDLLLIHNLLLTDCFHTIRLHVKYAPMFVSDATVDDVRLLLHTLPDAWGERFCLEMDAFLLSGRLELQNDPFWNAPLHFRHLDRIIPKKAGTTIIFKGDLNYRRCFEDRNVPITSNPEDLSDFLPNNSFAFRVLKSEIITGISSIDSAWDKDWLTNGRYAIIQKL